jgi:hypothetical protein
MSSVVSSETILRKGDDPRREDRDRDQSCHEFPCVFHSVLLSQTGSRISGGCEKDVIGK